MSKLQLVKIKTRTDVYGQTQYDIKTIDGDFTCAEGHANYDSAMRAAKSIDADMLFEKEHGAGSLATY